MENKKLKGRPSKTKNCTVPSDITIHLKDDDYIHYDKVDSQGYIRPSKREWIGEDVTVLVGIFDAPDGKIFVPAQTPQFLCEVLRNTYISSISKDFSGRDVTVIVPHGNI